MKKTVSLLLVIAMLMSAVVVAIPAGATATAENIDYIDALYFEPGKQPTVDGFISNAEWGSASFIVEASDCATKDDTSPYNRFLYWRTGERADYTSFEYEVWFRWSENYFYIGVKVYDPDGHSLKNGTTDTWNGDSVETRIDKEGANAATEGEDFWVSTEHEKPWSSSQVPDFLFGYVEIAGGFSEAWENTSNKGMTLFSRNPLGTALCVVAPANSNYSTDTSKGITTYEIGIPWAYILTGDTTADGAQITALTYTKYKPGRKGNPAGGIGRELGVSLAVRDDGNNTDSMWDAFMSWGSGVCEASQKEGAKSATGSNAVALSATSVTQTADYTTYDCASLLDATFSTQNIDPPNTFYDYLNGDLYKDTKVKYRELTTLTYDTDPEGDLSIWGAPEYKGHVTDIGGTHGNVLDYRNFVGNDKTSAATDTQTYIDTRDGQNSFAVPTSYTFEFDICYTDNVVVKEGYEPALYNWFGGSSGYAFMCGYFFNDKRFKIVNTNDEYQVLAQFAYDLKKDNWYNWKFQFDNESCTARLWIDDLSTDADNANSPWGTMVFNTCWRYFYYSSDRHRENGTLLMYRMMNTQCMYDNVKVYNFASQTKEHICSFTGAWTMLNDDFHYRTCECGALETEGHAFGTCTDTGDIHYKECATCGYKVYDDHHESERIIDVPVLIGVEGVWHTECVDCGKTMDSGTIPALDPGTSTILGDINGDGKVNAVDAHIMNRIILGGIPKTTVSDINGDTKTNAVDANLLKKIILGAYFI